MLPEWAWWVVAVAALVVAAVYAVTRTRAGSNAFARVTKSPKAIGRAAALEVIQTDIVPDGAGVDGHGRGAEEQRAAIAQAVASRAAAELGLDAEGVQAARNEAVRRFGFRDVGHVTLVLTGRTDWAQAIEVMAAAVAAGIAGGPVALVGAGVGSVIAVATAA